MSRWPPRRYQVLPDRAACHHPGCTFRRDGPSAEQLAEHHSAGTGHEVVVTSGATVTFTSRARSATAAAGRP